MFVCMWVCDLPFMYHSLHNVSTTKAKTAMSAKMTDCAAPRVQLDTHEHCMNADLIQSYTNNVVLAVY